MAASLEQNIVRPRGSFLGAALVILLAPLGGCTVASFEVKNIPTLNGQKGVGPIQPVNKANEIFIADPAQRKVDILFVDDNSPSMDVDQSSLGTKFPALAASLANLDWQMGITTTDCSNGRWGICGSLVQMAGIGDYILKPNVANLSQVFLNSIVRPETVGCIAQGTCPSGNEEPLKATIGAMLKRTTSNSRFFRDGAALAVVVLSDEDEQSDAPPTATTPQQVLAQFNAIWGGQKQLKYFAIDIVPGDTQCLQSSQMSSGGIAAYGTYASSLAATTGGLSESICSADFTTLLSHIGDNLQNLNHVLTLSHTPTAASVQIKLNPGMPGVTWSVKGNLILFSSPLPQGTAVDVTYLY